MQSRDDSVARATQRKRTWCGRARESLILSEATSAYPLRWSGREKATGLARRAARAMRRELMMDFGVERMQWLGLLEALHDVEASRSFPGLGPLSHRRASHPRTSEASIISRNYIFGIFQVFPIAAKSNREIKSN